MKPEKAEAWMKLYGALWPERLIWTQMAGHRRVRLDFYAYTESEARKFAKIHGGCVLSILPQDWWLTVHKQAPPLRFGSKLWIVATAEGAEYWRSKNSKATILIITHGMAFGTGEHETTAMCLRAMLLLCKDRPQSMGQKSNCIDIGTGSGILALAARALGFQRVVGVDHDATAIGVAREHARLNGSEVAFFHADLSRWRPKMKGDLVLANLYSEVLIKFADRILEMVAPRGFLVISGISRDQETAVKGVYSSLAFIKRLQWGQWVCLVAQRAARSSR
jgi:ribosomal protein L11 methyltransferase